MMEYFGVTHEWDENSISVKPQPYQAKEFTVEADWSAASYWYAIAAFSDECDLTLHGLFEKSLQGDSVLQFVRQINGDQLAIVVGVELKSPLLQESTHKTAKFRFIIDNQYRFHVFPFPNSEPVFPALVPPNEAGLRLNIQ